MQTPLSDCSPKRVKSSWLTDPDPCTWDAVTCTTGTVTKLWLTSNQLLGVIPRELGNLTILTTLWLSYNQLSGTIPLELRNLTNLTWLWLRGQTGCLTTADAALAVWLAGFDSLWNDGCP